MSDSHTQGTPVLQVVGYKNSGKTALITTLLSYFSEQQKQKKGHSRGCRHESLRIFTLKHDVHGFDLDQEGADTWQHRQAGATGTLIQSPHGLGLQVDQDEERSVIKIMDWVQQLQRIDLFLMEGFKQECFPKIVLIRHREDFQLLDELEQIRCVVFWREEDRLFYEQNRARWTFDYTCREQNEATEWARAIGPVCFTIDNTDQIIRWVQKWWEIR